MNKTKNKQMLGIAAAVIVSALLILAAYMYVVGGSSIFKGSMEGETVRARVIRVTDVKTDNVNGESEILTVYFKAQALNTSLRGKTIEVLQEIDRSYVFSPKQVEQGDKILVEVERDNNPVLQTLSLANENGVLETYLTTIS